MSIITEEKINFSTKYQNSEMESNNFEQKVYRANYRHIRLRTIAELYFFISIILIL